MTAIRTVSRRRRPFAFVQTRNMHPQWIGMAQITSATYFADCGVRAGRRLLQRSARFEHGFDLLALYAPV